MRLLYLLWAVAEDLGSFAYESVMSLFLLPKPTSGHTPLLDAPVPRPVLPVETETHKARAVSVRPQTALSARTPVSLQSLPHERPVLQKSTVMYTSSYATSLRSVPDTTAGVVSTTLRYGSMVMVLEVEGLWAKVASGQHTGWVYSDDLEDCAADVYPLFHIGEANHADDPTTIRARAIIDDEFGAGDTELPLQSEEYVLYRLARRGVHIVWPVMRPRTPGSWHEILKANPQVKVVTKPVAGALMEFMMESGDNEGVAGHIAYVEAIFPDDTIQISEANWPEEGIYNERVLVLEEWQALTPTFLVLG